MEPVDTRAALAPALAAALETRLGHAPFIATVSITAVWPEV